MIRLSTATSDGGGIMASNGTPRIIECVIEENLAAQRGGGIAWTSNDEATPLLIDATQVVSNTSLESGGGLSSAGAPASVGNSVFCDNDPDQIVGEFTDLGGNEICTDDTCHHDEARRFDRTPIVTETTPHYMRALAMRVCARH